MADEKEERDLLPSDAYDRWHDDSPITPDAFVSIGKVKPIPDDQHFGKRLRAAIEALPDDMKNDPAYADPVGWVKRARGLDTPSDVYTLAYGDEYGGYCVLMPYFDKQEAEQRARDHHDARYKPFGALEEFESVGTWEWQQSDGQQATERWVADSRDGNYYEILRFAIKEKP